ncbi:MAG: glycosyltransferase family 2 protein, partial [Nanoarchaeota archaeon]|nr:glycosyltransferase family 2 protein [Nanoarchaeota archaeon]
VENRENRGFSGGNNDGIKYAFQKYDPNFFYLLNNDTKVTRGWLTEAVKTAEGDRKIGIVGSKQLNFEGKATIRAGRIHTFGVKYYWGEEDKEVTWVSGAGFLIKKEVIMKIGMFDEMYNPAYYEETDFEKRAITAGFKIFQSARSIFLHKGGGTTEKDRKVNYDLIFYKNRARFFSKYNLPGFLIRMITDIIRTSRRLKFSDLIKAYSLGVKSRNKSLIENPYA